MLKNILFSENIGKSYHRNHKNNQINRFLVGFWYSWVCPQVENFKN